MQIATIVLKVLQSSSLLIMSQVDSVSLASSARMAFNSPALLARMSHVKEAKNARSVQQDTTAQREPLSLLCVLS